MMTIGHGTHAIDEFIRLLQQHDVRALVDVRAFPRSRHNPQFDRETLSASLERAGLEYRWAQELGGRRTSAIETPNIALRHPAFRAYVDYMLTNEFIGALDALLVDDGRQTAVMCSESVWWRCHRRLIADAVVLLRGEPVEHIMPDGKFVAHRPTEGVRVADGQLIYDGKE
ncbi:MAG TPA: DUF488 domain-containing protein [Candidatus Eremiobacteraceae bacterium]|nr:DUF488 domain-containing protein [Candidatus Eremiobacteraceae bacterium]